MSARGAAAMASAGSARQLLGLRAQLHRAARPGASDARLARLLGCSLGQLAAITASADLQLQAYARKATS